MLFPLGIGWNSFQIFICINHILHSRCPLFCLLYLAKFWAKYRNYSSLHAWHIYCVAIDALSNIVNPKTSLVSQIQCLLTCSVAFECFSNLQTFHLFINFKAKRWIDYLLMFFTTIERVFRASEPMVNWEKTSTSHITNSISMSIVNTLVL